jgi:hypothetical protein
MWNDLKKLALAAFRISKHRHYPDRWAVFACYARVLATHRFLVWTRQTKKRETFLGFHAGFSGYQDFVSQFEETFVRGTYSFRASGSKAPVIVDAGSGFGISVFFLKWLHPKSRVLAFEPEREAFNQLRRNVDTNGLQRVFLYNMAPSGENEAGLTKGPRSLSDFIDEPIDFMKIDIGGGTARTEIECLRETAARGRLREIREMILECRHDASDGAQPLLTEVLPVLESNGFRYRIRAAVDSSPANGKNVPQDVVLFAYRPSSDSTI